MGIYTFDFDSYLERKLKRIQDDPDLSDRNKEIILRYIKESQLGKTIRRPDDPIEKRCFSPVRSGVSAVATRFRKPGCNLRNCDENWGSVSNSIETSLLSTV